MPYYLTDVRYKNYIFSLMNMVSPKTEIRTFGNRKIVLGDNVEIRPNLEFTARNGVIQIGDSSFVNRNWMIVEHE